MSLQSYFDQGGSVITAYIQTVIPADVLASGKDGNNHSMHADANLGVDSESRDMLKIVKDKLKEEARPKRTSTEVRQEEAIDKIRGRATHIASEEPVHTQKSLRGEIENRILMLSSQF